MSLETKFVGAINIGTGVETCLYDIVSMIARATGALFANVDAPTASRMCADISRAKQILQWVPKTSLEEGIDVILNLAKV